MAKSTLFAMGELVPKQHRKENIMSNCADKTEKVEQGFNQLIESVSKQSALEQWHNEWIENKVSPSKKSCEIAKNTITNYSDS